MKSDNHNIHIIGAGGIGSWLIPQLVLMHEASLITVYDGDRFEHKNLARQLFDPTAVNHNKAEFMAHKYGVNAVPEYISPGWVELASANDFVIVCADNNPARMTGLDIVERDGRGGWCIIAANETTDAEAYIYERAWKYSALDPRVFYPTLASDHSGDPTAPAGCTGDASDARPQLVLANSIAAIHALHLWQYYTRGHNDPAWIDAWPVHHKTTVSFTRTIKYGEKFPGQGGAM